MRKRAEQVDQTRLRITQAAVELHTTIGPSNTTISSVAERAGVTRLTVYRHFADEDELFAACSTHWLASHPPPDPTPWTEIDDLASRACVGLTQLYDWYARNGDDLYTINRDVASMPRSRQEARTAYETALADALVNGLGLRGRRRQRVRAAAGHAVSFWTWRSFVVEQGLRNEEAMQLAVGLLLAATDDDRLC